MNRFITLILCVLSVGGLFAQSFPYQVSVETVTGHCYADSRLIITLLDENGHIVQIDPQTHNAVNTAQYPLYNVQFHYQNSSSSLGIQYDYSNDIMLAAGTYCVGVRACLSPTGSDMWVDTTICHVQVGTTYNHLNVSAIFQMASGNTEDNQERYGYRPSFHCADMGRIQLQITQGSFPYEVTILNEQQDTVRHELFYQRVNSGNSPTMANYRDYYTFDGLPIGSYTITVSDSCGYVAPLINFTIPDAQPVKYSGLVHTEYSYDGVCPDENVVIFEVESRADPQYNDMFYNYMYSYFDTTFRYRFINPGNDTTEWRTLEPPPPYSSSGGWTVVRDTLPNYCVMFNDTIILQVEDLCHDTLLTFKSRFRPQFRLLDSIKDVHLYDAAVEDTCAIHLQSGILTKGFKIGGDTWNDAGKVVGAGSGNYIASVPFRYFRCPLTYNIWSMPDSTLLGHAESDDFTGLGTWLTFEVDTTIAVRVSVTDALGCQMAAKDTVLVFDTEPLDDVLFWYECRNDRDVDGRDHCCEERFLSIKEHGVNADVFRRNMTLRLIESPLYNKFNFTAVRQDGEWTVTPDNPDNHSTYVEFSYDDGWMATVRDLVCLSPGRYTFEVTSDCGVDTITYGWAGFYYDTLSFTTPPQYEYQQICDRVVVTQVSTGLENYIYYIDPAISNDEPIQQECSHAHYCYSPSGISSKRDNEGRDVLVFSVPGAYYLTTYSYNNQFSYNSYQSVLGWCTPYVYYYDTITITFSYLDFDMGAALLCNPIDGAGVVSVRASNGSAPYTYTLYDQVNADGNVLATSTSGFFENVPMVEGQKFSVLVTDSCSAQFSINITAAQLTNTNLVWEQGVPAGTPHCVGDTLHLTALNFPSPAIYSWTGPGGVTTNTPTNEAVLPFTGEGWYKVEIHNSLCGALISDSIFITLVQPPHVFLTGDSIVCPGAELSLSFYPQGNGHVSFDVYHPGGHNSFTVNPNETFTHTFFVQSGGAFWVEHVSDDYCVANALHDTFYVGVYSVSTEVTDLYDTVDETQLPYLFGGMGFSGTGTYEIALVDHNGCDSTVLLHLTVLYNQLPNPQVSMTLSGDTLCEGDTVALEAVLVNAAAFANPVAPRIVPGDILCTDGSIVKPSAFSYSGKTALGIVFYVDSTEEHGWAVDLHNLVRQYNVFAWVSDTSLYVDIPDLQNYNSSRHALADVDGYQNTLKLRQAGDASQYPAAWVVDLDNGWYLPAIGQLAQMFSHLFVINASLSIVNGSLFPLNAYDSYWSSTESYDQRAWNLLYGGSVRDDYKTGWQRVRQVRDF